MMVYLFRKMQQEINPESENMFKASKVLKFIQILKGTCPNYHIF